MHPNREDSFTYILISFGGVKIPNKVRGRAISGVAEAVRSDMLSKYPDLDIVLKNNTVKIKYVNGVDVDRIKGISGLLNGLLRYSLSEVATAFKGPHKLTMLLQTCWSDSFDLEVVTTLESLPDNPTVIRGDGSWKLIHADGHEITIETGRLSNKKEHQELISAAELVARSYYYPG